MKNINIDHSGGYTGLAVAIIQQAAYDWLVAKLWLHRNPYTDNLDAWRRKEWHHRNKTVNDIERFFLSDYYMILTDLPGKDILAKLNHILEKELSKCEQKNT